LITTKKKLRLKYLKKRLHISDFQRKLWSKEIANQCLKLPIWRKKIFHIFLSIHKNKEVDTDPLVSLLKDKNKKIIIPKINGLNLNHFMYEKDLLIKKNNLGIPEPLNGNKIKINLIEVVFVPLIIVDKIGNRVGYGKGYYDRFLINCDKKVIKVGLSFFDIIEKIEDTTYDDIKLNYCITPKKIIKF